MSTTTDIRCGTNAGYIAHRRRDESACGPCKRAHRAAEGVRTRALGRLAQLYPDDFRRLLDEEREVARA